MTPGSDLPDEVVAALREFAAGRRALAQAPRCTPLQGGLTNRAWRVTCGASDWVVRVGGGRDAELAIDRRAECAALRVAAAHGLAPAIVHAQPDRGVLVLEHVNGRVWTRTDAREPANVERMGRRLRELHALEAPPGVPMLNVVAAIEHYLDAPPVGPAPIAREQLATCARDALAAYSAGVSALCHHDVHHLNVVDTGALVLLDWEYAALGDPRLDLAAFACYHDLDDAARARLLAAYDGASRPAEIERTELAALDRACVVFDVLQALWYDAAGAWALASEETRAGLVRRLGTR
jgi:thiamine kinase